MHRFIVASSLSLADSAQFLHAAIFRPLLMEQNSRSALYVVGLLSLPNPTLKQNVQHKAEGEQYWRAQWRTSFPNGSTINRQTQSSYSSACGLENSFQNMSTQFLFIPIYCEEEHEEGEGDNTVDVLHGGPHDAQRDARSVRRHPGQLKRASRSETRDARKTGSRSVTRCHGSTRPQYWVEVGVDFSSVLCGCASASASASACVPVWARGHVCVHLCVCVCQCVWEFVFLR